MPGPFRRSRVLLFAFVACAALPVTGRATESIVAPGAAVTRAAKPNPMMVEIRALLDTEKRSLTDLNARFLRAHDDATALALQREIAQLKLGTEVALLRVQARYARAAGRTDVAAYLEGAIRTIESPPVSPPAITRPAAPATEGSAPANAQR